MCLTIFQWNGMILQRPDGGIGRRKGLKIPRGLPCAGSIPAPGTTSRSCPAGPEC